MTGRTIKVFLVCVVGLLATPVMLAAAIMGAPPEARPAPPLAVVAALDADARAGDWDKVFARVDFRAKGQSLLPDLWAAAQKPARDAWMGMLRGMFRRTWTIWHQELLDDSVDMTFTELRTGKTTAVVDQLRYRPGASHPSGFRYWLEFRAARWTIIDRSAVRDGIQSRPRGRIGVIRKRIAGDLGRPPTLREFVANAPSWNGRVHERTIRMSDLMP